MTEQTESIAAEFERLSKAWYEAQGSDYPEIAENMLRQIGILAIRDGGERVSRALRVFEALNDPSLAERADIIYVNQRVGVAEAVIQALREATK